MQLNKDISRTNLQKKEKSNTDLSSTHSIPIHSLNPLPYGEDEAAQPPERKGTERNDAYRVYEEIIKDNIEYNILLQDMLKTVEQMSKVSGIGENKLRELMDNGELEYVQNGNRRLIADTAIWDWYERAKNAVKPPAEQGG